MCEHSELIIIIIIIIIIIVIIIIVVELKHFSNGRSVHIDSYSNSKVFLVA